MNGNLTSDGTNTYAWDARNHLVSLSGANAASFVYDPAGRRAQKTINGVSTQFLYDGSNPVQEIQNGAPSANLFTGLGIDEFFQRTDSANGAMSLITDILGSTLALSDSSGTIQTQYTYEPFGTATSGGTANANSYQFTGRENDGTGLYFYRARYYSPTLQRFIPQDLMGFGGGDTNLYGYTSDDPLSYIDPSGLGKTTLWNNAGGRWGGEGPTNGNYGGEDWSGGLGPGQYGPPAPPQDSGDRCYAAHDSCFDDCNPKRSCHDRDKCRQCNQQLVQCLVDLPKDPRDWPEPPIPGTERDSDWYRQFAINLFEPGWLDK